MGPTVQPEAWGRLGSWCCRARHTWFESWLRSGKVSGVVRFHCIFTKGAWKVRALVRSWGRLVRGPREWGVGYQQALRPPEADDSWGPQCPIWNMETVTDMSKFWNSPRRTGCFMC